MIRLPFFTGCRVHARRTSTRGSERLGWQARFFSSSLPSASRAVHHLETRLRTFFHPTRSKLALVATAAAIWLGIEVSFVIRGYEPTWRLWGVEPLFPYFVDLRLLPGTVQSLHMGYDPRVYNPGNPLNTPFNLPGIWYVLAYTPISQHDTLGLAIALVCLFFFSLFLFPGRLPAAGVLLILLVAFSPAAMLLYERMNVDLLMFFLCAIAIAAEAVSMALAVGALSLAMLLKFYPLVGASLFLSRGRKSFLYALVLLAVIFAAYLLMVPGDLQNVWSVSGRLVRASYGATVLALHFAAPIGQLLGHLGWAAPRAFDFSMLMSYALALLIASLSIWRGLRKAGALAVTDERNLAAFRVGAAIYLTTFLLGNNADYRLVFLIFVLPQLYDWWRSPSGRPRVIPAIAILLVLLSCWGIYYEHFAPLAVKEPAVLIDELVNWALFAALAHLFAASLPDWLRTWVFRSAGQVTRY